MYLDILTMAGICFWALTATMASQSCWALAGSDTLRVSLTHTGSPGAKASVVIIVNSSWDHNITRGCDVLGVAELAGPRLLFVFVDVGVVDVRDSLCLSLCSVALFCKGD